MFQKALQSSALPEGVGRLLSGYEQLLGLSSGVLSSHFRAVPNSFTKPFHYSLNIALGVGKGESEKIIASMTGLKAISTAPTKTFGFSYLHGGAVLNEDAKKPIPPRSTIFHIDFDVIKPLPTETFMRVLELFEKLAQHANHDPLHGVNGDPQGFVSCDKHLRYGGIEFAPLIVHSAFVQSRIARNSEIKSEIAKDASEYLDRVSELPLHSSAGYGGFARELYLTSIYLRHLLLLFPLQGEVVQSYLQKAQNKVFRGESITVSPSRFSNFLNRDFSSGEHPDQLAPTHPSHTNRSVPYNHGRESILGPWLHEIYARSFGKEMQESRSMPFQEFLVLDVLGRGHGTYAVISACTPFEQKLDMGSLFRMFCPVARKQQALSRKEFLMARFSPPKF